MGQGEVGGCHASFVIGAYGGWRMDGERGNRIWKHKFQVRGMVMGVKLCVNFISIRVFDTY